MGIWKKMEASLLTEFGDDAKTLGSDPLHRDNFPFTNLFVTGWKIVADSLRCHFRDIESQHGKS
jgi:hypothetical protein